MQPRAIVSHVSPGRVRFRVPERTGDRPYFRRVREAMRRFPAVSRLELNPVTGSVLVYHDGPASAIAQAAAAEDLFEVVEAPARDTRRPVRKMAEGFFGMTESLDKTILELTEGEADLGSVSVMALLGLSLYQIRNGKFLPAGLPLIAQAVGMMSVALYGRGAIESYNVTVPQEGEARPLRPERH